MFIPKDLFVRVFLLIVFAVSSFGSSVEQQEKRLRMVEAQIEARGIRHKATREAMRKVPRHQFVGSRQEAYAYEDRPLPIGYGQTISQPYIVAYMTEVLDPAPHHRALEVGAGSGYQSAVLAEIVDRVYCLEIVPKLAASAKDRLETLGYKNIQCREGDGYFGWEEAAPFDLIIVTAVAEHIPPPLIDQLRVGGRMIIPVGTNWGIQHLVLVTKSAEKVKTRRLIPVSFVPFTRKKK